MKQGRRAAIHRLYVTALSIAATPPVLVAAHAIGATIHDRIVVAQDFACYDRAVADVADRMPPGFIPEVNWTWRAGQRCHIEQFISEGGTLHSSRAWFWRNSQRPPFRYDLLRDQLLLAAFLAVPLVVLVLLNRRRTR